MYGGRAAFADLNHAPSFAAGFTCAACSLRAKIPSEMTFGELVRRLEQNGLRMVKEKGSIRYYAKLGETRPG